MRGKTRRHPTEPDMYWCNACKEYHHKSAFGQHNGRAHGLALYCRVKTAEYRRKYGYKGREPKGHNYNKPLKLEMVNRSNINGFKRYFSERTEAFLDIYGKRFSDQNAVVAFQRSCFD